MALPLSQPDPSSSASIAEASFGTARRGFDQSEVRDFLRKVAAEFGRLEERQRFLEREVEVAKTRTDVQLADLDEETLTRLLGEESVRLLTTARSSGNEIRQKAEEAAARLLADASIEAARVREEADLDASRRRSDAVADAEAELSMAKQQGREMVSEAQAYRERVLAELARRREAAREQIEQLVHGRDRLLQAFERARLVAVDVVSELQPLGEPDEYVNLEPTTGPLPVMIANSPRPYDGHDEVIEESAVDAVADEMLETDVVSSTDDVVEVVDDAPEATEDVADEPAVVEPADDTSAENDAEPIDDVVVDLFARLRADADIVAVDESETAQVDESESARAAIEPDTVMELEDVAADAAAEDDAKAEPSNFEVRDAELDPLIAAASKKLKRLLADEQNDVLDALRSKESVDSLNDLVADSAEHSSRYAAAIADEIGAAVAAGAATSKSNSRALRKALAAESSDAAVEVLDQWLVWPLRDRLDRCIADGDGDNAQVTKKVRSVYREFKTRHIDEQLDDIVRTAHGRGTLAGFDVDAPVVWMVDSRHAACPDCDDNALSEAVPAGDEFPTGHTFAPAHPGCRCLLAAADR